MRTSFRKSAAAGGGRSRRAMAAMGGAVGAIALVVVLATSMSAGATKAPSYESAKAQQVASRDQLGVTPGTIKHVWLIILENKSYDASFTGLNNNTYLWETLPKQGVLLKHYYGTGHFSLDNYISAVSGQATQPDTQADCPRLQQLRRDRRHVGQPRGEPELRAA
jgi:phospholipase C